jgi:hypothetical protein
MEALNFEIEPYVDGSWNVTIKHLVDGNLKLRSEFAAHKIDGDIVLDSFKSFHPSEEEKNFIKSILAK